MTRIDGLFEDQAREHSLRVCAHTLHKPAAAAAAAAAAGDPRILGMTTQMTMMMVMLVTRET